MKNEHIITSSKRREKWIAVAMIAALLSGIPATIWGDEAPWLMAVSIVIGVSIIIVGYCKTQLSA